MQDAWLHTYTEYVYIYIYVRVWTGSCRDRTSYGNIVNVISAVTDVSLPWALCLRPAAREVGQSWFTRWASGHGQYIHYGLLRTLLRTPYSPADFHSVRGTPYSSTGCPWTWNWPGPSQHNDQSARKKPPHTTQYGVRCSSWPGPPREHSSTYGTQQMPAFRFVFTFQRIMTMTITTRLLQHLSH